MIGYLDLNYNSKFKSAVKEFFFSIMQKYSFKTVIFIWCKYSLTSN